MHLHILGICGSFMAGIASIAVELGHAVTGCDANTYPPMSDLLAAKKIPVLTDYAAEQFDPPPDCTLVGNALSRGNPAVETLLDRGLRYSSGPQWLAENVLFGRTVVAVAGTHGKTTTSAMLAWILEQAGLSPGFLIGGVPGNFDTSARLGRGEHFVIEADEYDTAFFDKRSKFVHYRPRILLLNNLEFDHADIFPDLAAISRQFHHLVRTVPGNGLIVSNATDPALAELLAMGCWTPVTRFDGLAEWRVRELSADASRFEVLRAEQPVGRVDWPLFGRHNAANALGALVCAQRVGVSPADACRALATFASVKRRLEERGEVRGVKVYDDFAHHPTAVSTTLAGLRARVGSERIVAVLELASNSMRLGVHEDTLADALSTADRVWVRTPPALSWAPARAMVALGARARVCEDVEDIVVGVAAEAKSGDHVLVMSNGGFESVHERLLTALRARERVPS